MRFIGTIVVLFGMCCVAAVSAELQQPSGVNETSHESQELAAYVTSIREAIERQLIYPPGSGGQQCTASVGQAPSGLVLNVVLSLCSSNDVARAVQVAIFKASPLPLPADKSIFKRNLVLKFVVPNGQ